MPAPHPTTQSARRPSRHRRSAEPANAALDPERVLAAGDPTWDTRATAVRLTPSGLSEQQLLAVLNQSDVTGLQALLGLAPAAAERLIDFRRRDLCFATLDELVRAPLIGTGRFRQIVGRDSRYFRQPLHSTLGLDYSRDVLVRDFQPLLPTGPDGVRIFLGTAADCRREREAAGPATGRLSQLRIGPAFLSFHFTSSPPSRPSARLAAALPRVLRRILLQQTPA